MNTSSARWVPLREPRPGNTKTVEQRYGFDPDDDVEGLLNELREIGTRDHLPDWSVHRAIELRKEVREAVDEIKELADQSLGLLKLLQRKVRYFETHEYHPQLMRYVFAKGMNSPSEIGLPDHLKPFYELLHPEEFWSNVAQRLCHIGEIELRVNPGPPSDDALAMATRKCRDFWKSRGQKGSDKFQTCVEHGDDVAIVSEPFERFCVDCLGAAGIDFAITDLRIALSK